MTLTPQSDPMPPADYQLLLPEGWFRVHIDPERRERSVDALVERQFNGIDNAPQIKAQVRQELIDQATKAFDEGGIELYLSLQQAGPLTVPASLLIALGLLPREGVFRPWTTSPVDWLPKGMTAGRCRSSSWRQDRPCASARNMPRLATAHPQQRRRRKPTTRCRP